MYKMPDYEYVHKELQKSGVTLKLLWLEYCERCRENGELPYQSTQFNKYYSDYAIKTNATMHLNHKPGEIMQVDWAGDTAAVIDTVTGEIIPAYLFVASLPYSGYAYAESFFSMNQECWTAAHVNAFKYFGGVTRILQCDNLKTGVISHGRTEVREPALYNAIITAIATGASRMSEISGKVGESTNICSAYVKNLISLGIIEKETPYGEKASRKAIYSIADNMFRFWYRFVPENNSIIARGAADLAYKRIEPYLSDYMGKVFEEICKQYLWKQLLSGECPVEFSSLGRWWGNDPKEKRQAEIDILAEQDKNTALFGECKWTNEKVDLGVLETLVKRSELFPYKNVHYYLFAKTGFTKGCADRASEMGNVTLVSYKDIVKVK